VVVYDDDIDYPAFCRKRNVETMDGYDEYCALWRDFIDLKTEVRWRNNPKNKVIPRIQELIEDDKRLKDTKDKLQKEIDAEKLKPVTEESKRRIAYLNAEFIKTPDPNPKKQAEYRYYEAHHISIWEQMDALITKLGDNAYVKNRNDNDLNKLEDYRRALYDMIDK
jgi:hypothetical protein